MRNPDAARALAEALLNDRLSAHARKVLLAMLQLLADDAK